MCDFGGRDCMEGNHTLTFNCSATCQGVYADVDWVETEMQGWWEKNENLNLHEMVEKYQRYKRENLINIRFNATKASSKYGKRKF